MSRDKQIEEMAREIPKANCIHEPCDECKWCGCANDEAYCTDYLIAEHLYNAGYRKAEDVAREMLADLKSVGIDEWRYPIIAELKKKYTESEKDNDK